PQSRDKLFRLQYMFDDLRTKHEVKRLDPWPVRQISVHERQVLMGRCQRSDRFDMRKFHVDCRDLLEGRAKTRKIDTAPTTDLQSAPSALHRWIVDEIPDAIPAGCVKPAPSRIARAVERTLQRDDI